MTDRTAFVTSAAFRASAKYRCLVGQFALFCTGYCFFAFFNCNYLTPLADLFEPCAMRSESLSSEHRIFAIYACALIQVEILCESTEVIFVVDELSANTLPRA